MSILARSALTSFTRTSTKDLLELIIETRALQAGEEIVVLSSAPQRFAGRRITGAELVAAADAETRGPDAVVVVGHARLRRGRVGTAMVQIPEPLLELARAGDVDALVLTLRADAEAAHLIEAHAQLHRALTLELEMADVPRWLRVYVLA